MTAPLIVENPAPHVRRLVLNRPEQLNTMTAELCEALHVELRRIAAERGFRAVIITGAGRGFCAGLDLHGYGAAPGNEGNDEARNRLANQQHMSSLILGLRALPQPVIAAVNGPAAGFGLALALGCDIRYAAEEAVFRVAFLNIGVSNCDMGTSWLLPRLIGASRSHELMLTGRRFGAEEALRIGLVADVVAGASSRTGRSKGLHRSPRRPVGGAADQAGDVGGPRGVLGARVGRVRGSPADHVHLRDRSSGGRGRVSGEAPADLRRLAPPAPVAKPSNCRVVVQGIASGWPRG